MKNVIFFINIIEGDFGASTSAKLTVNNNYVIWVEDTSTYNTNYIWDGWEKNFLRSLIGKHISDVKVMLNSYFDWFYSQPNQLRQPYVNLTM